MLRKKQGNSFYIRYVIFWIVAHILFEKGEKKTTEKAKAKLLNMYIYVYVICKIYKTYMDYFKDINFCKLSD